MNKELNPHLKAKKHYYKEPAVDLDRKEFVKLVKSRRSVRVFTDDEIDSKDIKECLE